MDRADVASGAGDAALDGAAAARPVSPATREIADIYWITGEADESRMAMAYLNADVAELNRAIRAKALELRHLDGATGQEFLRSGPAVRGVDDLSITLAPGDRVRFGEPSGPEAEIEIDADAPASETDPATQDTLTLAPGLAAPAYDAQHDAEPVAQSLGQRAAARGAQRLPGAFVEDHDVQFAQRSGVQPASGPADSAALASARRASIALTMGAYGLGFRQGEIIPADGLYHEVIEFFSDSG
jgi:hypothetical protein